MNHEKWANETYETGETVMRANREKWKCGVRREAIAPPAHCPQVVNPLSRVSRAVNGHGVSGRLPPTPHPTLSPLGRGEGDLWSPIGFSN